MSDNIPSHLIWEILSRLPAVDVLRFRCVCKSWCDMIDDPKFTKYHFHRRSSNGGDQLIVRDVGRGLFSLPVDRSDGGLKIEEVMRLYHNPWMKSLYSNCCRRRFAQVRSCDGVLLISTFSKDDQYTLKSIFLNPSTRESHKLPRLRISMPWRPVPPIKIFVSDYGFGYDCTSDDYKVVFISQIQYDYCGRGRDRDISFESETMLYGLKSDTWRRIKDFPHLVRDWQSAVFLNGALHWIVGSRNVNDDFDFIGAIDLGTEDYFQMPLPLELSKPDHDRMREAQLTVLDGSIAMSYHYPSEMVFEVWLMNDYKVDNSSWSKLFSIAEWNIVGFWPVSYSKSRGTLLLEDRSPDDPRLPPPHPEFLSVNLEKRSWKKITVDGVCSSFAVCRRSTLHLESLVRLNNGRKRKRDHDHDHDCWVSIRQIQDLPFTITDTRSNRTSTLMRLRERESGVQ